MIDVNDSIIKSLDGQSREIFGYLPYLLKDLWEIGSSAKIIVDIIRKNNLDSFFPKMKVLDIGCGKGAVSLAVAKKFNAGITGLDAMPAFINEALNKADEMNLGNLCKFIVCDIRTVIKQYNGLDIAIAGSIGPILGNVKETLENLRYCINDNGYVILDDGYLSAKSRDEDSPYLCEDEYFRQIEESRFEIADKYIHPADESRNTDNEIYNQIEKRAKELIKMHPEKAELFEGYLKRQRDENEIIENSLINTALLLKKI
jgi:cyclopropane fatty-acyl-phospholipid synthase-like methyltransferase